MVHCALDDLIPFNELFAIPYVFWYFLVFGTLLWFLLYDIDAFKKVSVYIIITQAVAMAVYILWPSRQDLRPDVFLRDNALTRIMAFIYAFDTPTGVCPSLHVAYSLGISSVWCRKKDAPLCWKIFVVAATVVISVATTFVKQHSALDVLAAVPLGLLAEFLTFRVFFPKNKTE